MTSQTALQTLLDRAEIVDVANTYARAVDTRDWTLFRSIFTDRVFLDFRTFNPELYREYAADEIVEMSKRLAGFDSTQHLMATHLVTLDGDKATCVAYTQASHFLKNAEGDHVCILYGYYTHTLARTSAGWRISGYSLTVTGQTGEPRVFEWVGFR